MSEESIKKKFRFRWWYLLIVLFLLSLIIGMNGVGATCAICFLFLVLLAPAILPRLIPFWMARDKSSQGSERIEEATSSAPEEAIKFPWRYALLNMAILFCLGIAYGIVSNTSVIVIFITVVFLVPLLILFCLCIQRILFFALRRFVTNRIFWFLIMLLPSIVWATLWVYTSLPITVAKGIIRSDMAPLPKEAHSIQASDQQGSRGGEAFLRFEAPPAAINEFVNRTAQLQRTQPQVCSKGPFPRWRNRWGDYDMYFFSKDTMPPWFPEEVRSSGRFLRFEPGTSVNGFVLTDDANNVIYVYLMYGH